MSQIYILSRLRQLNLVLIIIIFLIPTSIADDSYLTSYIVPNLIQTYTPLTNPGTTGSTAQTFTVSLNWSANVSWQINGIQVAYNYSTTSASYTNNTPQVGTHNVTAVVGDGTNNASRTWTWTVTGTVVPSTGGGGGGGGGGGLNVELNPPMINIRAFPWGATISIQNEGRRTQEYKIEWVLRDMYFATIETKTESKLIHPKDTYQISLEFPQKGIYTLQVYVYYQNEKSEANTPLTLTTTGKQSSLSLINTYIEPVKIDISGTGVLLILSTTVILYYLRLKTTKKEEKMHYWLSRPGTMPHSHRETKPNYPVHDRQEQYHDPYKPQ